MAKLLTSWCLGVSIKFQWGKPSNTCMALDLTGQNKTNTPPSAHPNIQVTRNGRQQKTLLFCLCFKYATLIISYNATILYLSICVRAPNKQNHTTATTTTTTTTTIPTIPTLQSWDLFNLRTFVHLIVNVYCWSCVTRSFAVACGSLPALRNEGCKKACKDWWRIIRSRKASLRQRGWGVVGCLN